MKIKIELEDVTLSNSLYYGIYIKRHWYNHWRKVYQNTDINDVKEKFNTLKDNKYYLAEIFNSKDEEGSIIEIL